MGRNGLLNHITASPAPVNFDDIVVVKVIRKDNDAFKGRVKKEVNGSMERGSYPRECIKLRKAVPTATVVVCTL